MSEDQMHPAVLHERLNAHSRRLEVLEKSQSDLADALTSIKASISQIKWLAVGAILTLLSMEMGWVEAIKLAL
jgi:hypothetical protein